MADTRVLIAQWITDKGWVWKVTSWPEDRGWPEVLEAQARRLEADGRLVFRARRIYERTVPVILGEPVWTLAGPMRRLPEGEVAVSREVAG